MIPEGLIGQLGIPVVLIAPEMSRRVIGFKWVKYDVHPIIHWLAKYLPIDPWIDGFVPEYKDIDPFIMDGKLYVTPKQWEALKHDIAKRGSGLS